MKLNLALLFCGLSFAPAAFSSPIQRGCGPGSASDDLTEWARFLREGMWRDAPRNQDESQIALEPSRENSASSENQGSTGAPELTPEERAALATIRYAEGADYDRLFGWFENKSRVFDPMTQVGHPESPYTSSGGNYTSSAAGAYQAMPATWNEEVRKGTITNDFTPANQDRFALARLEYRGLLDEVRSGNTAWIDSVEMGREWASFPNSPYGQPTHSSANLRSYYQEKLREYQLVN